MHHALESHVSKSFYRRHVGVVFVTVLLTCLLILSACSTGAPPSNGTNSNANQPKKGGNLSVGLIAEPTVLDPLTSVSLYDSDIMVNMYDTLLKYDTQNVIRPQLASYAYASPTLLKLTLRTDVKFQDGTPFNADAVIFNINRFLNDKASPRFTDVSTIDSLVKVSDSEVDIKLKKPFSPLLNVLTGAVGMMLSPKAVQDLGKKLGNAPTNAGSGPFLFGEWIKGDHLLLKANPNYWGKDAQGNQLPYLQTIRYRTITNATVMYNNLETRQIQVASNIDPTNVEQAKSNPGITYKQIPGPGFASIQLNLQDPLFSNIHVRRAIAWGINRPEILHNVLKDVGLVAKGPLSPVAWAYDKNFVGFSYDVDKAKAELAQANLSSPVSFTMLITGGNPTLQQEAQFIQSELQPVGIKVDIKQETFTTLVTDFQTFHYQALIVGWTGSLDPDGTMYPMFTSQGGFNYTKYANTKVDQLLESGRTTTDQAQRIPFYQQAQQLIVEDASRIFITHGAVTQTTTSDVKNYPLRPSGVIDLSSVYLSS